MQPSHTLPSPQPKIPEIVCATEEAVNTRGETFFKGRTPIHWVLYSRAGAPTDQRDYFSQA